MRLDVYLAANRLADSRERAKRLIEKGNVSVNGTVVKKPAFDVEGEVKIEVQAEEFVGRGGEKLEAALTLFGLDVTGLCALDIGASTGGFTHCLLKHGAKSVTALDAGFGQLHPTLRADARVRNIEKYNARSLTPEDVGCFDVVVMDVSFISQTYILPRIPPVLNKGGFALTLIKPQFEAGREALNKNGIVRTDGHIIRAVRRVLHAAAEAGLRCRALAPSPILGGDGNREFLAYFVPTTAAECAANIAMAVEKTVSEGVMTQ